MLPCDTAFNSIETSRKNIDRGVIKALQEQMECDLRKTRKFKNMSKDCQWCTRYLCSKMQYLSVIEAQFSITAESAHVTGQAPADALQI